MKWKEISKQELQMKSYPPDSNAAALILYDYIESYVGNDLGIETKRHTRIKIFNEKAFPLATENIYLGIYGKEKDDVDDIEGYTYNLDNEGEVQKTEFDDDDVIKDKVTDTRLRIRFTMPALKPGCIIEYRYKVKYRYLFGAPEWSFQQSEPTLWSEYRFRTPVNIGYAIVTMGYLPLTAKEQHEVTQVFSGQAESYLGQKMVRCNEYRFVATNVPALREEPYITTLNDYRCRLRVQLSGYAFQSGGVKQVLRTWDQFVNDMAEEPLLADIKLTGAVEDQTNAIIRGISSPKEKMRAIYHWVSQSISNNGDDWVTADKKVNETLESKNGNSGAINYLMLAMLKHAGVQAQPVILSTRGHGIVHDAYPILSQFNKSITRVILDSQVFYLDACDPNRPMGILPIDILGVKALVISPGTVEFVQVPADTKFSVVSIANATLDTTGALNGTIESKFIGYAAVYMRAIMKKKSESEVIKDFYKNETEGMTVDSIVVTGLDSVSMPMTIRFSFNSPTYAQVSGDMMYINPHLLSRTQDNPFKSETRAFDIDYGYCSDFNYVSILTLPPGYEVKEIPQNAALKISDDALQYQRYIENAQQNVKVIQRFTVTRSIIRSGFYQEVKKVYAGRMTTESQQIVLKKAEYIPPPSAQKPQTEVSPAPTPKQPVKPKKGQKK
jgi:hypothetical protein